MKRLHSYISVLAVCLLACFTSGCGNDDNNVEAPKDLIELIVDKPVVRIGQGDEVKVKVVVSNGACIAKSFDESIATATMDGETLTIKGGSKNGATTVELVDAEGVVADVSVNVGLFDLEVNASDFEIEVGAEKQLIVSMGNFSSNDELSLATSADDVVSITNSDPLRPYYTLKGLKIGEDDIVITDKKGKQTTVHVSVTPLEIEVENENLSVGVGGKIQIAVAKGNGGYACEPASTEDAEMVSVTKVDDTHFLVEGKAQGKASVVITDQYEKTLTLTVNVVKADKVAYLGSNLQISVPFEADGAVDGTLKHLNSITYEARFNISSLNGDSDAKINTVMGVEGICLLRVDVHKGGNSTDRYLQLAADKKGGIRFEGSTKIETNRWYNVAVTVDESKTGTDRIALYVNGVKETLQLTNGTPNDLKDFDITSNYYIGYSEGKRRLNGAITYARIWNKALTADEIADQSGKLLSGSNDGLVANWTFSNMNGNTNVFTSYEEKVFEAKVSGTVTNWVEDEALK